MDEWTGWTTTYISMGIQHRPASMRHTPYKDNLSTAATFYDYSTTPLISSRMWSRFAMAPCSVPLLRMLGTPPPGRKGREGDDVK